MGHLRTALVGGALVAALMAPSTASAASSKGCDKDGGFSITLGDGSTVREGTRTTIAASRLNTARLLVRGKFINFDVDPATFAVYDYTFTGAANVLDITGGRRIVAFAGKVPDHRGLTPDQRHERRLKDEGLEIARTGPGLSMKIQAKNCANGGLFQMEPERGDGTATRITHTLGPDAFYYDNPRFREREGDVLPYKDTTATVAARVNIGSDVAPQVRRPRQPAGRHAGDAGLPQLRSRRRAGPAASPPSTTAAASRCGTWPAAAGWAACSARTRSRSPRRRRRAPQDCQAQNQVRGEAVVLGFPFPVPAANRFFPRFPGVASGGVQLTLDHVILRAADPAATLAELADRAGAPILAQVHEVGGLASGIVRAGAIDIEVLRIGAEPPPHPLGYGLGFTADVPLAEAVADLRERGFPCLPPARATADGRALERRPGARAAAGPVPGAGEHEAARRRSRPSAACWRGFPRSRRPRPARPAARWSSSPTTSSTRTRGAPRPARGRTSSPSRSARAATTGAGPARARPAPAPPQRPGGRPPDHVRRRRRPVPARRRRVRVQLGGVIDSELGSPARSFATWSVRFVSDSRSVPDWTACEHDRLHALDLLRALERRLELRAGRDHEPVVVARDQVARRHAHAAEQDRPADPRRDVAAARHRDRAARPHRQVRQPGAIAHVAVDHDPAQLAPPRLGGQQLAQRGQRRAARLHDQHVARRRLADRVQHREELARGHDRVRGAEHPRRRQRPDRGIDDRQGLVDVAQRADGNRGERVHRLAP